MNDELSKIAFVIEELLSNPQEVFLFLLIQGGYRA